MVRQLLRRAMLVNQTVVAEAWALLESGASASKGGPVAFIMVRGARGRAGRRRMHGAAC